MELTQLALKHKRAREWHRLLENEVKDQNLSSSLRTHLEQYNNLLAECWESEGCSSDQLKRIQSLERELGDLTERARLMSGQRTH